MGLFSRKSSKVSTNGQLPSDGGSNRTSASIKSPKLANGASFSSLALPEVKLAPPPDPSLDPAAYLKSVHAIRARTQLVYQRAKRNQLQHFTVDGSKFGETAAYVVSIIKRDFAPDYHSIPAHGRWQHFEAGGRPRVDHLLASWSGEVDAQERTRRLLDLFLVSVLLDAGAGSRWSYKSVESGKIYRRSEGLAIASLEMFKAGYFSSSPDNPCQVDSAGLQRLSAQHLAKGLQISEQNPIAGLEGRAGLLARLAKALRNTTFFGSSARPGGMLGTSKAMQIGFSVY